MVNTLEKNFKLFLEAIEIKDLSQLKLIYKSLTTCKDQAQQLTLLSSLNTMAYIHYKNSLNFNGPCIENVYKKNLEKISQGLIDPLLLEDYYSCLRDYRPTVNDYINSALDYIKENLDQDLSLDLVASQVHLNKNYFSNLFKKTTGLCFCKYVNHLRIQRAKDLLQNTSYPLDYIAQKCGYKSQSHFGTTFSSYQGTSPGVYRKTSKTL